MKKWMLAGLALLPLAAIASTAAIPSARSDSDEVAKVVKTAVDKVVAVLRNDSLDRVAKREKSMEIVEPLIDFKLLAMLSLGKTHWSAADANQRTRFTDLFAETLKLSYFEKLELFTDEDVEFEEPVLSSSKGSPKYFVMSYIVSKGDRIKVGYHLTKRGDSWKVFNFEIEGVSILKSYGSQYNDYLKENSFDQLLKTMQEKIDTTKAKDSDSDSKN